MKVISNGLHVITASLLMFFGGLQSSSPKTPQQNAPAAASSQAQPAKGSEEAAPPGAIFPAVVARVNGQDILGRDLDQRVQAELSGIGNPAWNNLRPDYQQDLTNRALAFLISSELLYQKASESGIKAADSEVQAEVAKVAKTFSSDADMNAELAKRGIDRASLTRDLSRGLVVTKFVEEAVGKKVVVTPAEAQQYYSEHPSDFRHPEVVRTSQIFILVPAGASTDQDNMARQRAEALLQRIKKGEDFAKLAKEHSMDGSASQGGDIGFVPRGELAPEYEQVAFSLPTGTVSDVVHTQFGYHIIKVTDRKQEGVSTLEEVRSDLIEFLKNQKIQAEVAKYVADLRSKAKIEVLIPIGAAKNPGDIKASSPRP